MMEKVFHQNDVYELIHRYECEGDDTLMISYRQPNGWGVYQIKVSASQCQPVTDQGLNKRQMLVYTGWQDNDSVLEEQCKRDYGDIRADYEASGKFGTTK